MAAEEEERGDEGAAPAPAEQGEAAPAEPPTPARPLYAAGFVCLYEGEGEGDEFRLGREEAAAALARLGGAETPLNVDHRQERAVGRVLRFRDTPRGLFCLARVDSPNFLRAVGRVARYSAFAERAEAERQPPDLYYLNNALPSLSLTTRRGDGDIHHVALCGLGRRRGTVALYGPSAAPLLDSFGALTAEDRAELLVSARGAPGPLTYPDSSPEDFTALLASVSANACLIPGRLPELKEHKREAEVRGPTYLHAKKTPEVATAAAAPMDAAAAAAKGADTVPVPRELWDHMVMRQGLYQHQQTQAAPAPPPLMSFPHPYALHGPQAHHVLPPQHQAAPGIYHPFPGVDPTLANLIQATVRQEMRSGEEAAPPPRSGSRKRKYEDDGPRFPGERSGSPPPAQHSRGGGGHDEALGAMLKSMQELSKEVGSLRSQLWAQQQQHQQAAPPLAAPYYQQQPPASIPVTTAVPPQQQQQQPPPPPQQTIQQHVPPAAAPVPVEELVQASAPAPVAHSSTLLQMAEDIFAAQAQ